MAEHNKKTVASTGQVSMRNGNTERETVINHRHIGACGSCLRRSQALASFASSGISLLANSVCAIKPVVDMRVVRAASLLCQRTRPSRSKSPAPPTIGMPAAQANRKSVYSFGMSLGKTVINDERAMHRIALSDIQAQGQEQVGGTAPRLLPRLSLGGSSRISWSSP